MILDYGKVRVRVQLWQHSYYLGWISRSILMSILPEQRCYLDQMDLLSDLSGFGHAGFAPKGKVLTIIKHKIVT